MAFSFALRAHARRMLLALALLTAFLPAVPLRAEAAAAAEAAPAEASAVTPSNLRTRERDWPYRVALTRSWKPPGRDAPFGAGTVGVLIRIQSSGAARIDFSSAGKYDVPVDHTDIVDRANRIRRGELEKQEPNFVRAIALRVLDPDSDPLEPLKPEVLAERPGFLCVFADPSGEAFEAIAAALAPLRDRHRVLTILFPQGEHPDPRVRDRLGELGWKVPFVYDFLSEPYTGTLLEKGTPMPFLLLQTGEGRVVFQSPWRADAPAELKTALDAAFGDASSQPSEPGVPASGSEDLQ